MKNKMFMTYIQILDGMLIRKQAEVKIISNEISVAPDVFNKKKFVEIAAEIKMLETCIEIAKVMFNNETDNETD